MDISSLKNYQTNLINALTLTSHSIALISPFYQTLRFHIP